MGDEHLISLQPGTVIAGRYEVVKSLGAGSMGVVYACRHRELAGHLVSVKVLFPEFVQDKVAAARFRNEICASYGVSHPNVVRAYEYLTDGDLVAYTMEYVSGGDLAERLDKSHNQLQISEIVSILSQMCAGVQAIHDAGIIHRDLKPENILIAKEGRVKITDFGIARTDRGPKLTEHGGVVGTLHYVSPEYMVNSQVDWRSDIYAIGILSYEMLTGEAPFRGDNVYDALTKRLKSDPPSPSKIRQDCPPELDAIVLQAMNRDPNKRYQAASDIYEDLRLVFPNWVGKSLSVVVSMPPRGSISSAHLRVSPVASHSSQQPDVQNQNTQTVQNSSQAQNLTPHDQKQSIVTNELNRHVATKITSQVLEPQDSPNSSSVMDIVDGVAPAKTQQVSREITLSKPKETSDKRQASKSNKRVDDYHLPEDDLISEGPQPTKLFKQSEMLTSPQNLSATQLFDRNSFSKKPGGAVVPVKSSNKSKKTSSTGKNQIHVGSVALDIARMRKVSAASNDSSKSKWADYAVFVVALFIGIGLGVAILEYVVPSFIGSVSANQSRITAVKK
jgi:serine/threonine protein kinase